MLQQVTAFTMKAIINANDFNVTAVDRFYNYVLINANFNVSATLAVGHQQLMQIASILQ